MTAPRLREQCRPPSPPDRRPPRRGGSPSSKTASAAALLALSVALALPATAQEQTTFVSNIEEVQLRGNLSIQAQSFTTGPNIRGYKLSEVVLNRVSGGQGSATYVKVKRGTTSAPSDASSDLVANLSTPGGGSPASFTAPANTTLAANTIYWVVVNEGRGGSSMSVGVTESDNQTVTTADPNWDIANARIWKNSDSDDWETSPSAVMIAIKGFTADRPEADTGNAGTGVASNGSSQSFPIQK